MHALPLLVLLAVQAQAPPPEAVALKKSCDNKVAADCYKLAGLVKRGEGVPPDAGKAADLLKKACELNVAPACLEYAAAWRAGEGVKRDPLKAVPLYQKACDGSVAALFMSRGTPRPSRSMPASRPQLVASPPVQPLS